MHAILLFLAYSVSTLPRTNKKHFDQPKDSFTRFPQQYQMTVVIVLKNVRQSICLASLKNVPFIEQMFNIPINYKREKSGLISFQKQLFSRTLDSFVFR